MAALITELLSTPDTYEVVRDQIAQILADELEGQKVLAGASQRDYDALIYSERVSPIEEWLTADDNYVSPPVVSVWFQSFAGDAKGSTVDSQRGKALFNLDCFALGLEQAGDGPFVAGDQTAKLKLHRTVRLVRQILMSGHYTYLGSPRGSAQYVLGRSVENIQFSPPERGSGEHAMHWVATGRITLAVDLRLTQPQVQGVDWNGTDVNIKRAADGKVLARGSYNHTPTP